MSSRHSPALVPHTCAVGPTFRYGAFRFVALALVDSSSARLTTCKPQNTSASYRSITNRHQPPTICSTNKSLLNMKKGFAERTSPRLFSENSMPNQARLKLDYGADEIAYPPTTKGRSREAGAMRGADLHPALSSPSATPLRSGGYASKVKRADGTSASADATKKDAPYGR